jgi:hypothetical protein
MAAKLSFGTFERGEQLVERELVGDHEDIDVARRGISRFRDRPEQQGEADAVLERSERATEMIWNACGLLDDRAQLVEDR